MSFTNYSTSNKKKKTLKEKKNNNLPIEEQIQELNFISLQKPCK